MTGFIVVLLLLAAVAGVVVWLLGDPATTTARAEQRLRQRVVPADAEIGMEARKARRAMNTAAGQSWRNRFE
ncbi:MAG: hypothetical protein ACRCYU_16140 [Nocardioides sp.]